MEAAEVQRQIEAALKAPYARIFRVDEEGGFVATVLEMPGIVAGGEDLQQTHEFLEEQMAMWVESVLERGHPLPEPIDDAYSGRLTLRITPTLHQHAQTRATLENVSLNRLLEIAVAQYLGGDPAAPVAPKRRASRAPSRVREAKQDYES